MLAIGNDIMGGENSHLCCPDWKQENSPSLSPTRFMSKQKRRLWKRSVKITIDWGRLVEIIDWLQVDQELVTIGEQFLSNSNHSINLHRLLINPNFDGYVQFKVENRTCHFNKYHDFSFPNWNKMWLSHPWARLGNWPTDFLVGIWNTVSFLQFLTRLTCLWRWVMGVTWVPKSAVLDDKLSIWWVSRQTCVKEQSRLSNDSAKIEQNASSNMQPHGTKHWWLPLLHHTLRSRLSLQDCSLIKQCTLSLLCPKLTHQSFFSLKDLKCCTSIKDLF